MPENSGKILILGAMGFIGSNLTRSLLEDGYDLRLFVRSLATINIDLAETRVEVVEGDFRTYENYSDLLESVDTVIHLIHSTFPGSKNDDPLIDVSENLIPTLRLAENCISRDIKKLIFVSSGGAVYGIPDYLPIDENHGLNPISSYGLTKLAIERYLQYFSTKSNLKTIILRVANPYGQGQKITKNQGLIGVYANHIKSGQPVSVYGDGNNVRDYILMDDVVEAIKLVLNDQSVKFDIFNIGSGEGRSINDILRIFENILQQKIEINYLEERNTDVNINILSSEKFKKKYNWNGRGLDPEIIKALLET